MNNDLTSMGTEPISKLLFRLAVPVLTGMFANALYNIVDRIFIGNFIGKEALAGATVFHPSFMVYIAVGVMIGVGSVASVSRSFGAKDYPYAERILETALTLSLILTLPLTILGLLFDTDILRLSGTSENIMPYALDYFRIMLLGFFPGTLGYVLSCFIRSENHPKFAMSITLIGATCNIILDALFIIVFEMGIEGAAIATVISQVISAIYALSFYLQSKSILKIRDVKILPSPEITKKIIGIGISSSVVLLSFGLFSTLMNHTLYKYGGDDTITVNGILMSLSSILFLPIIGICDAAQPIFGYNYGAKLFKRIYKTLRMGSLWTFLYGIISFIFVVVFSRYLIMIFTDDVGIITEGSKAIKIVYSAVFFAGFGIITSSLFQALGRVKICIFLGLCRTLFVLIPMIYFLPKYFGLNGAWLCLAGVDLCGAIFGGIFYYFERKRLKKEEAALIMQESVY